MITFKQKGNFVKTERFLNHTKNLNVRKILESYGWEGVRALASATPVDTGLTAISWEYDIEITRNGCKITWLNTNVNDGVPIAILIQYGHGTKGGAYIQGIDYINPVMKPLFEKIAEALWSEVCNL